MLGNLHEQVTAAFVLGYTTFLWPSFARSEQSLRKGGSLAFAQESHYHRGTA
jgi:predicted TPR repeat methyltransferase